MQHELIVKRCKSLMEVCVPEDVSFIQGILDKSQAIVDDNNKNKKTVTDITNTERSKWMAAVNIILDHKFCKKLAFDWTDFHYSSSTYIESGDFYCKECTEKRHKHNASQVGISWMYKEYFYMRENICDDCAIKYDSLLERADMARDKVDELYEDFKESVDKTIFPEDLMINHIFTGRKYRNNSEGNRTLIKAVRDTIKTEIIKTFQEQNQEFLTKYY